MSELKKSFDERALQYDQWIYKICPFYEEGFDALINVLPERANFLLELGCGTGNLSLRLMKKYPKANFTVVDLSKNMLEVTRNKLKNYEGQIHFIEDHRFTLVEKQRILFRFVVTFRD